MDRQHKLLDLIGFVALEARSGRDGGLDDPILDDNTRPDLATPWALPCMPGRNGSVDLSMPLGLMSGRPFNPFSHAISLRCSAFVRSNSAIFSDRLATRSFSWEGDRPSRSSGGLAHSLNRTFPSRHKKIIIHARGFAGITALPISHSKRLSLSPSETSPNLGFASFRKGQ
jgi:hypothetical protein